MSLTAVVHNTTHLIQILRDDPCTCGNRFRTRIASATVRILMGDLHRLATCSRDPTCLCLLLLMRELRRTFLQAVLRKHLGRVRDGRVCRTVRRTVRRFDGAPRLQEVAVPCVVATTVF